MNNIKTDSLILSLNEVETNKTCTVCCVLETGIKRRRLFDLGIIQGSKIKVLGKSPLLDPTAYLIRDTVVAFRSELSSKIIVKI